LLKLADSATSHVDTFGRQQLGLQVRGSPEASQPAPGSHDTVVGQSRLIGKPHDLTHRARRTGPSGQYGEVTVRDDTAGRHTPERMQHLPRKRSGGHLK